MDARGVEIDISENNAAEFVKRVIDANMGTASMPMQERDNKNNLDYVQWSVQANGVYRPTGKTADKVPPGVYKVDADNNGVFLIYAKVITDDLVPLPGAIGEKLLPRMARFWTAKDKYHSRGLLHKKGAIFYGPPAGGKTSEVNLLMKQLIEIGGIVVICDHPGIMIEGLKRIRAVEPYRNIICVYEDIDEIIARHGDHQLLTLLDGEEQIDNVFHIATTNYIDQLEARISARPGRFDLREYVPMPTAAAREVYIKKVAPELGPVDIRKWVDDTDGFSLAHIRELSSSVFCLDEDYGETLNRLKLLRKRPKDNADGFTKTANSSVGFELGR